MRRFLLRLTLFVPFVLAMAAINRSVDPARLFGRTAGRTLDGYEDLILVDLRAGRPHPIEDEYSRRLVFEELVRDRTSIDVLVLGSSICTPFHSENFPGQTMVNGAVPGGDLEEAMCMYELACEERAVPEADPARSARLGHHAQQERLGACREFRPDLGTRPEASEHCHKRRVDKRPDLTRSR